MNKIKIILSMFFLFIGLVAAILTYNLSNEDSFGQIRAYGRTNAPSAAAGGGVDSSNDGVAIGLGIVSGFAFLSSTILLNSIYKTEK